jgi:hypothetical protein
MSTLPFNRQGLLSYGVPNLSFLPLGNCQIPITLKAQLGTMLLPTLLIGYVPLIAFKDKQQDDQPTKKI